MAIVIGSVVLALIVVAGVAYALSGRTSHQTASGTTTTVEPATTATTVPPTSSPTTSPPTTAPPPSATVDISAVSSNQWAGPLAKTLEVYFGGINTRDFPKAYSVLSAGNRSRLSYQAFVNGSTTSVDSAIAMTGVGMNDTGGPAPFYALVSFTSHQSPDKGPNPGETCTMWTLTYHFVAAPPGGVTDYLIDSAVANGTGHSPC